MTDPTFTDRIRFRPSTLAPMQWVTGVVQHYPWGDPAFIPRLLGIPTDGRPWAELWLGTHPNGPATLADGRPLRDVTGRLPYLLKVLAAVQPLSLQAHPNREQAAEGFAAGRYPDPDAKPELLCALTPFTAYCGIRPVDATLDLLDAVGARDLAAVVRHDGPGAALEALYRGRVDIGAVVEACGPNSRPEAAWVTRLASRYPGEPSVAATLLLNLVELAPGEAIELGPGNLHAYLGGAGIELMGASDNTVRGGLTDKPVDVDDLLAVVDPTPLPDPVLPPSPAYALGGTTIRLLRLDGPAEHTSTAHQLVITTSGATGYLPCGSTLTVDAGTTAYVATS